MTIQDFIAELNKGTFDERLDSMQSLIVARRQAVGAKLAATIQKGARVRISNSVRPKYLAGVVGTYEGSDKPGFMKIKITDPAMLARISSKYLDSNSCIGAPSACVEAA